MDYQDVRDGPNRHDTSRDNKIKPPSLGGFFYYSLVRWGNKPIPEEWQEETPIHCPNCNHAMNVEDDDFMNHVITAMFAD